MEALLWTHYSTKIKYWYKFVDNNYLIYNILHDLKYNINIITHEYDYIQHKMKIN